MLAGDIYFIMGLWAASLATHNDSLLFKNTQDMYNTIDATGNIPWQSFTLNYSRPWLETLEPDGEEPLWKTADYNVWFYSPQLLVCKMIGNPEFKGNFEFTSYQEYSMDGQHCFQDFITLACGKLSQI